MVGYPAGDIVLISFPFTDASGAKRRPALVLLDTGDQDIVLCRVTSQPAQSWTFVELRDWQASGLLRPSVARIDKLATIEKRLVERTLGSLGAHDWTEVRQWVRRLWAAF